MLDSNSRYKLKKWERNKVVYDIALKDGADTSPQVVTVTTYEGDTFDKIAARVLGDSTQYWRIAGLNPTIRFPDAIPAGTVIAVPVT